MSSTSIGIGGGEFVASWTNSSRRRLSDARPVGHFHGLLFRGCNQNNTNSTATHGHTRGTRWHFVILIQIVAVFMNLLPCKKWIRKQREHSYDATVWHNKQQPLGLREKVRERETYCDLLYCRLLCCTEHFSLSPVMQHSPRPCHWVRAARELRESGGSWTETCCSKSRLPPATWRRLRHCVYLMTRKKWREKNADNIRLCLFFSLPQVIVFMLILI